MINYLIYLFISTIIIFISRKKSFLPSFSGEKHQLFVNQKKIPLIGGFLLITPLILIFMRENFIFLLSIILIFIVGFLSDAKILSSAKLRILCQTIIILFFVVILKIEVTPTKIEFIDKLFEVKILSFIFTCFCLLILVNGSNFIDGLNGLLLGYFLLIIFILYKLNLIYYLKIDIDYINYFTFVILTLLFFNYLNLLFLGDGGSYIIGLISGVFLILIYNNQNHISPFFIIFLLWYPCFENLFSILRKNKFKNSAIHADNRHLHQLLFFFINKKYKFNDLVTNNLSSVLINIYNLFAFLIASKYLYDSFVLIVLIIINIIVYSLSYRYLFNFRFSKKK